MTWIYFISHVVSLVRLSLPSTVEHWGRRLPCMVVALFVFITVSCAKQGYPPGGPTYDPVLLPEILTMEIALEIIASKLP